MKCDLKRVTVQYKPNGLGKWLKRLRLLKLYSLHYEWALPMQCASFSNFDCYSCYTALFKTLFHSANEEYPLLIIINQRARITKNIYFFQNFLPAQTSEISVRLLERNRIIIHHKTRMRWTNRCDWYCANWMRATCTSSDRLRNRCITFYFIL